MVIKGYDVWALLKKTWSEIGQDKLTVYAAQMAYTMFFSLFPLLIFFAALFSLVFDRQQVMGWFDARVAGTLPGPAADLVQKTIAAVVFAKGAPGLLSFGIIGVVWAGMGVFGSMRDALNTAYDVTDTRPWWRQQLLSLASLIVSGLVLMVATIILLNGETVVRWIGELVGLGRFTVMLWTVLQFPLAIGFVVAVIWGMYYFLPNTRHPGKTYLLVGAVLATALWLVATLLFRLYVQHFGGYNPAYGAIGGIMVLLSWLYYSMFVLLAAGELSSELRNGSGKVNAAEVGPHGESAHEIRRRDAEKKASKDARRHGAPAPSPAPPAGRAAAASSGSPHPVTVRAHAGDGRGDGRTPPHENGRRGIAALVTDLAHGAAALARGEIRLARLEVQGIIHGVGRGTAAVVLGGVLALLGVLAVITGIILLAGDQWLADRYWLAALIVLIIAGAVVLWLARRARARLTPRVLALDETTRSLAEDRAWGREELNRLRGEQRERTAQR